MRGSDPAVALRQGRGRAILMRRGVERKYRTRVEGLNHSTLTPGSATIRSWRSPMALNIKNPEVERLLDEVVTMTGETKVEAVRRALMERKARLGLHAKQADRWEQALRFLQREVWPVLPPDERGRRLSKIEEDAILGYGPEGL